MKTIILLIAFVIVAAAQTPPTPPPHTNYDKITTNAPVNPPWHGFTFDTNYLAASLQKPWLLTNEYQPITWVTNIIDMHREGQMRDTNSGAFEKRRENMERNDFISRALNNFKAGLATNTYSTDFNEHQNWISTNRP